VKISRGEKEIGRSQICRFCGAEIRIGEALCPRCGRPVNRPTTVSIISVLSILWGMYFLIVGVINRFAVVALVEGRLTDVAVASFAIWFIVGPILLVGGIGLWKLTAWGWGLSVIGLIIGLGIYGYIVVTQALLWIPENIIYYALNIILSLIIVGYLFTKRKYFGIQF